jgi:DNA end-binding protein Ku
MSMAARAIWKGVIRFEDVEVPVKLYSAVQDRNVRFRLLDARAQAPVRQQMVNPESGRVVAHEDVVRGFETDDGAFVILDADELAALEPEPSRDVEVTRFVAPAEINHQWYDRPYYLGPDGDEEAYFALAQALDAEGREGVAHWVMRKKEYAGALRAVNGYLLLITLRSAEEVVAASALQPPEGRALDARELKMAEQLVEALSGEFNPADYRDEYRDRVHAFVEQKAKGGSVKVRKLTTKRAAEPDSLADVLAASIKGARKKGRAA